MTIELTVLISLATAIGGFALSWFSHRRASRKEASEDGKTDGVILTQLGYMQSTLDDIKLEQRQMGTQYTELVKEVSMMQRDLKTAFSRIDDTKKDMEEIKRDIRAYHPHKIGGQTNV